MLGGKGFLEIIFLCGHGNTESFVTVLLVTSQVVTAFTTC